MIGPPSWFHTSPARVTLGPPTLGQHTLEILAEHGYSEREISDLLVAGVI